MKYQRRAKSSYNMQEESHTISVLVENAAGVLARVIGLFSGRGYNIDSLTVAEVNGREHISRIIIVTHGSLQVIEQIKAQLSRLVPVYGVVDLTAGAEQPIEREMALLRLHGERATLSEACDEIRNQGGKVITEKEDMCIFEITGTSKEITIAIRNLRVKGELEVSRTGILAISRQKETI